jgi:hypothetical protein
MLHNWAFKRMAGEDFVWGCTRCPAEVGFNPKGVGNPWASDAERPENIDDYVDPKECPDAVGEASSRELVQILAKAVDIPSMVLAGKITRAEADKLEAVRIEVRAR